MTASDIAKIEAELGVTMPTEYRILLCGSTATQLDEAGIFDDASLVVGRTKEQRAGYGGAPPWQNIFVYVGDQEDACPYALDVTSGIILQTDHGSLSARPLARYASISELAAELLSA